MGDVRCHDVCAFVAAMLAEAEPEMYSHVEHAGSEYEPALLEILEYCTIVSKRKLNAKRELEARP